MSELLANERQFTRKQIDAMRAQLAKQWRQTVDQVTEYEARYYLRAGVRS